MTDAITATYVCTSGDFSSVSESSAEAHLLANPTHGLSIVHAGDDSVTSHAAFVEGAADAELQANKGAANGYAGLDGGGKVPVAQLPNAILTYKGTWDALTNTPTLADGIGTAGDVYRVSVEGTQDLGSGSRTWHVGDYAIYNTADIWEDADTTDAVSSVNTYTGAVVLAKADVGLGNVTNDAQLKASDLDADGTLAANSATKVPSQSAVKTYADTKATDSLVVHKAGAESITGVKSFSTANDGVELMIFKRDSNTAALKILSDGKIQWWNGTSIDANCNLYRVSNGTVGTTGSLRVAEGLTANNGITVNNTNGITLNGGQYTNTQAAPTITRTAYSVTGDPVARYAEDGNGKLEWGSGAVARDTDLYRYGVDRLGTHSGVTIVQTSSIGSDATAGLVFRNDADNFTVGRIYARGDSEMGTDGTWTHQGNHTFNNTLKAASSIDFTAGSVDLRNQGSATSVITRTNVNGDTQPRFAVQADGKMLWGLGGITATDTNLYRSTTNRLKTDGYLHVGGDLVLEGVGSDLTMTGGGQVQITGLGATTATALLVQRGVDTQNRYRLLADGKMSWGNGTDDITTQSSNLYRPQTSVLKSDGRFEAVDGITTKVKAGTPVDGDFQTTPSDGTMVVDTTGSLLWVRVGGSWLSTTLA